MRRTRAAFTFIELCTTISIIAILAAILFPVFARAREKARQMNCQSNLKQIGLALSLYARDYAGHFPPRQDDLTPIVDRYLLDAECLTCPSVAVAGSSQSTPARRPAVDYFYRAGFCDDDDPRTPLAADSDLGRHNGGAACLFADGHTKWFKDPREIPNADPALWPVATFMKERGLTPEAAPPSGPAGAKGPKTKGEE